MNDMEANILVDKYDGAIIALWYDGDLKAERVGFVKKIGFKYKFHWLDDPYDLHTLPMSREEIEIWTKRQPHRRKILCYADDEVKLLQLKLKHSEWFEGR